MKKIKLFQNKRALFIIVSKYVPITLLFLSIFAGFQNCSKIQLAALSPNTITKLPRQSWNQVTKQVVLRDNASTNNYFLYDITNNSVQSIGSSNLQALALNTDINGDGITDWVRFKAVTASDGLGQTINIDVMSGANVLYSKSDFAGEADTQNLSVVQGNNPGANLLVQSAAGNKSSSTDRLFSVTSNPNSLLQDVLNNTFYADPISNPNGESAPLASDVYGENDGTLDFLVYATAYNTQGLQNYYFRQNFLQSNVSTLGSMLSTRFVFFNFLFTSQGGPLAMFDSIHMAGTTQIFYIYGTDLSNPVQTANYADSSQTISGIFKGDLDSDGTEDPVFYVTDKDSSGNILGSHLDVSYSSTNFQTHASYQASDIASWLAEPQMSFQCPLGFVYSENSSNARALVLFSGNSNSHEIALIDLQNKKVIQKAPITCATSNCVCNTPITPLMQAR